MDSINDLKSYAAKLSANVSYNINTRIEKIEAEIETNFIKMPVDKDNEMLQIGDDIIVSTESGEYEAKVAGIVSESEIICEAYDYAVAKYRVVSVSNISHKMKSPQEILYDSIQEILDQAVENWATGSKYELTQEKIETIYENVVKSMKQHDNED